ncbi:MAG: hypothetical protein HQM09_05790 [Candidatus Riflebacteria bacterium]|nr:hypothetical protein [Candidatus Riflebacteria bacterium]
MIRTFQDKPSDIPGLECRHFLISSFNDSREDLMAHPREKWSAITCSNTAFAFLSSLACFRERP